MVILLTWVGLSAFVGWAAGERGRSRFKWGLLSFLLSPLIGFIALIAAGDAEEEDSNEKSVSEGTKSQSSSTQEFDPDEHDKKCPDCAEYIKLEARVCKHCGHGFSDEELEKQVEEAKEEEVASSSGEPPKVENPIKIRDTLDP